MKSTNSISANSQNTEKLARKPTSANTIARKSLRQRKQADATKDEEPVSSSGKIAALTDKLTKIEQAVLLKSKALAQTTDDYVHASPWQAVAIAAGAGFLISHFLASPKRPK
ncbi:DUF883 family protein [Undibacterium sp. TJN19]|uniref:DUF883 family protein n=1 Tax=Undibacterium sp. TJN19 TaxID=3413055 RepID=UPI003BF0587F